MFQWVKFFFEQASTDLENEDERQVASLVAPVLITVAAICLAVIGFKDGDRLMDTIFGSLGIVSMLGAALLIDFVMDSLGIETAERWYKMNFGYAIFSTVISGAIFSLLFMYQQSLDFKKYENFGSNLWILYLLCSITIFAKLMIKEEPFFNDSITILALILTIISIGIASSPYTFGFFLIP